MTGLVCIDREKLIIWTGIKKNINSMVLYETRKKNIGLGIILAKENISFEKCSYRGHAYFNPFKIIYENYLWKILIGNQILYLTEVSVKTNDDTEFIEHYKQYYLISDLKRGTRDRFIDKSNVEFI